MDLEKEEQRGSNKSGKIDYEVWGEFPLHLLERAFLSLPVPSLLKMAVVCRDWHTLVSSRVFNDEYACCRMPWFMLFPQACSGIGLAYDPLSQIWIKLPLYLPSSRMFASKGGLVCLMPDGSDQDHLFICNPLNRTCKTILKPPDLFRYVFVVMDLVVQAESKSYEIIIAGSSLVSENSVHHVTVDTFNSTRNCWNRIGAMHLDRPISMGIVINSTLYGVIRKKPVSDIVAFDLHTKVCTMVQPPVSSNIMSIKLINHHGFLLLIGGTNLQNAYAICMWELCNTEWKFIAMMPEGLCQMLLGNVSRKFLCIGQDDFIYFVGSNPTRLLFYWVSKKLWHWIGYPPDIRTYSMNQCLLLQARLDITPCQVGGH